MRISWVLMVVGSLAACEKSASTAKPAPVSTGSAPSTVASPVEAAKVAGVSAPAPMAPPAEPIEQLRRLKTEACACTDAVCAKVMEGKLEEMSQRHASLKATEAQIEEAAHLAQEFVECTSKASGVAPPASSEPLEQIRRLKTEACACKDAVCAKGVEAKLEALGKRYANTRATDAEMTEAAKLVQELMECTIKVSKGP